MKKLLAILFSFNIFLNAQTSSHNVNLQSQNKTVKKSTGT